MTEVQEKRIQDFRVLGVCLGFFVLFGWGFYFLPSTSEWDHSLSQSYNRSQLRKYPFILSPHCPEVVITLSNSLGFYVGFPGHFPKLVQPLAFWTSEFKYCQIRFKSCVKAWQVHHCPQFKKHYRGRDIATKKVALIPHFIKGSAVVCITAKAMAPPAPGPREPALLSFPLLSCSARDGQYKTRCHLFFTCSSDLALNFPSTRCQCLNNILKDPKRRNYSPCFIHIKSETKGRRVQRNQSTLTASCQAVIPFATNIASLTTAQK